MATSVAPARAVREGARGAGARVLSVIDVSVLKADPFVSFGAGDAHVDVVVVSARIGELEQELGGSTGILAEAGPRLCESEESASHVGRDEDVPDDGALVTQPHLDHEPIAILIEA